MQYPNIALVGESGSGKSTLADWLIARHNYARVSLARPVKLTIGRLFLGAAADPEDVLAFVQKNKAQLRGLLQEFAQCNRELIDRDRWLKQALRAAEVWNDTRPVVVDDCRYQNEAEGFRQEGWVIVRIVRPEPEGDTISAEQRQHASETESRGIEADLTLYNTESPWHLWNRFVANAKPGGFFDTLRYVRQQQQGGF